MTMTMTLLAWAYDMQNSNVKNIHLVFFLNNTILMAEKTWFVYIILLMTGHIQPVRQNENTRTAARTSHSRIQSLYIDARREKIIIFNIDDCFYDYFVSFFAVLSCLGYNIHSLSPRMMCDCVKCDIACLHYRSTVFFFFLPSSMRTSDHPVELAISSWLLSLFLYKFDLSLSTDRKKKIWTNNENKKLHEHTIRPQTSC